MQRAASISNRRGGSGENPSSVPGLLVVLLLVDVLALLVLGLLDALLLVRTHVAVRAGARFGAVGPRLAVLELADFAVRELARLHALLDALLLVDVALHVGLHALRRRRVGIALRGVVLELVDIAALLVLRALDASLFLRAQVAVLLGVGLHPVDARLIRLELRSFAGVERPVLQALLAALLLVDV